jgi:hypothetical protein
VKVEEVKAYELKIHQRFAAPAAAVQRSGRSGFPLAREWN